VLRYKRLDGVTEALRTIADRVFAGGRQTERLGELPGSVPTLVIWGSDDRIIPSAHASAVPAHARVELLHGQGHSPHMEASGDVNRLIEQFVSSAKSVA
jgi:pyruvate dehydrogenase E2 component (dihydrolipoamide acetyltransferase)